MKTLSPKSALTAICKWFLNPHLLLYIIRLRRFNKNKRKPFTVFSFSDNWLNKRLIQGKTMSQIRFGDSSRMTLEQKKKKSCFCEIQKSKPPKYLYSFILFDKMSYRTRHHTKILLIKVKHHLFQKTFFSSTKIKLYNFDCNIQNSASIKTLT